VYQAVTQASITATPTTSPAPRIVAAQAASGAIGSFPDPTKWILELLMDLLDFLRQLAALLPGPLGNLVVQILDVLISIVSSTFFTILAYSLLDPLIYFGPFVAPVLAGAAIGPAGLAGLAGLGPLQAESVAGPQVEEIPSAKPSQQIFPAAVGAAP